MPHKGNEHDSKSNHDDKLELNIGTVDRNRLQQRGHSQDEQQIGDIGANYIANRKIGFFVKGSGKRGSQFRQRRTKSDQRNGDNELSDAQQASQVDRASTIMRDPNTKATMPTIRKKNSLPRPRLSRTGS